jgi:hypothetical protein
MLSICRCEINSSLSLKLLNLVTKSATHILLLTLVCIKELRVASANTFLRSLSYITKLQMHNLVQWAVKILQAQSAKEA